MNRKLKLTEAELLDLLERAYTDGLEDGAKAHLSLKGGPGHDAIVDTFWRTSCTLSNVQDDIKDRRWA